MGLRAQRVRRAGAALPAALFGLVAVTVLASAIFAASTMQSASTRNRESSARALQLAEDGLAHAVTVVRDSLKGQPFTRLLLGSDGVASTADDGRVTGFGLSSAISIPAAGRDFGDGRYTAMITDDNDGDGNVLSDANYRVRLRCEATTSDGGKASLDVILGTQVLPAIASNGDINMSTGGQIKGYCGSVHANDDLTITGTPPTISGTISASDVVSGTARDTLGATKTPLSGRDTVSIPSLTYSQFCGTPTTNALNNFTDVEYWLSSNGTAYRRGGSALGVLTSNSVKLDGWNYRSSTKTWEYSGATGQPGKLCIEGNVDVSGNVGSPGAPMAWSIIATGSVKVSGTPYLAPATADSISIVSGGDVSISGNPTGTALSFEGLIYANAQCLVSGTPTLRGQILCKDNATGANNTEYGATTTISGTPVMTYSCGGAFSRRRIYSWLQRVE